MNDSFGGAYMIYVFIAFVIVFITLIALIINYSCAFDVKNTIVNILEESETSIDSVAVHDQITEYIDNSTYRVHMGDYNNTDGTTCNREYGYCYEEHETSRGIYYTVNTFVKWEFPFFGLSSYWKVTGETKILGNAKEFSLPKE